MTRPVTSTLVRFGAGVGDGDGVGVGDGDGVAGSDEQANAISTIRASDMEDR